ncbi:glycosyl hydrolase family 28-related protein [Pantoea stewartii]|uniref:glycosyl hydrolase family 28-related protein n=1 Tax=Pantoea stewartii TaxID=66269 RepID=UPI001561E675|nr:glycosyl hydrolase family 28-related protein [Pantoea stewartii]NRH25001.1 hypothetical protein [Pantoea stewartii]
MDTLYDYIFAPDMGIYPDTSEDLSEKLIALLNISTQQKKGIYFPAGVYLFSQDIQLKSFNSLKGDVTGTVFRGINNKRAVMFGDGQYGNTVANLTIENIIFENATLYFYGRKTGINVNYNVFINTVSDTNVAQLTCSTKAYLIKGNVFMRGRGYPGVAINTYGNAPGLIIEQNFLGSITDISVAEAWIDATTKAMLLTLIALRTRGIMTFDDEQGHFVAGWYSTSNLKKGVFRKNFFSGSTTPRLYNPASGENNIVRDHAVYIKAYDQVEVVENYFSGWPADASGQLKFRNARGLVFAGNYLKSISFDARPYDDLAVQWRIMQDTFIFNNYLNDGMISYWSNIYDTPEKHITVSKYLVFSNLFINRSEDSQLIGSPGPGVTLFPDAFLCAENRFADSGKRVVVAGVIAEIPLPAIIDLLPDYALPYLNLQPIMPAV